MSTATIKGVTFPAFLADFGAAKKFSLNKDGTKLQFRIRSNSDPTVRYEFVVFGNGLQLEPTKGSVSAVKVDRVTDTSSDRQFSYVSGGSSEDIKLKPLIAALKANDVAAVPPLLFPGTKDLLKTSVDTDLSQQIFGVEPGAVIERLRLIGTSATFAKASTAGTRLQGSSNADTLIGNVGNDVLQGRAGGDLLTGDGGSDTFSFRKLTDSRLSTGKFDRITDFNAAEDSVRMKGFGGAVVQALAPVGVGSFSVKAAKTLWDGAIAANEVGFGTFGSRQFLLFNDSDSSLTGTDALVEVTGLVGTPVGQAILG